MRLRRMSVLAAGIAVAIVLMPGRAVADLLLDPGSATTGSTVRDPGSLGFGQGVSDPLSFTLQSGSTYYFGAIQDANTGIVAPFFSPPISVTQNGLDHVGHRQFKLREFHRAPFYGAGIRVISAIALRDSRRHRRTSPRTIAGPAFGVWRACDGLAEPANFQSCQAIERTTPPSTRRAAPLIADASGLETNATSTATSSGVANR
jgi:hypothetical protein